MPKVDPDREQTLLDHAQSNLALDDLRTMPGYADFVAGQSRAYQFILDPESAEWIGDKSIELQDLAWENREFAKPPYIHTYVEFTNMFDEAEDVPIGVLLSNSWLYIFSVIPDDGVGRVSVFSGRLNTETGEIQWGDSADTDDDAIEVVVKVLQSAWLWTSLFFLILNKPKHLITETKPRISVKRRGKRVVYSAHTVVKLNLLDGGKALKRAVYSGARAAARRHAVRGHFVHYHTGLGCSHDWQRLKDTETGLYVDRWTCPNCGGLRVWRKSFHRGDATVGFTHKDRYAVSL